MEKCHQNPKIWTTEKTLELIKLYKENPILWDIHHLKYSNRMKRNLTLERMSKQLNVQLDHIRLKINCLRATFRAEQRKIHSNQGESNWMYYKAIKFLKFSDNESIVSCCYFIVLLLSIIYCSFKLFKVMIMLFKADF